MKLNNNPKKRSNFFLKISACAMLICVMLAVFILPSSAEISTDGAINGGEKTDSPFGSDVYYEVTIPRTIKGTNEPTYEMVTLTTVPSSELYMLDTYGQYNVVDSFATITNYQIVMRCNGGQDSYSLTSEALVGVYNYEWEIKSYIFVTKDVNSLNNVFALYDEATEDNVSIYYDSIEGVTVTVYNQPEPSPIDTILGVFLGISEWLGDALIAVIPAFWTGTELTILGVLAVAALAVALVLLLVNFVRKFLQLRG